MDRKFKTYLYVLTRDILRSTDELREIDLHNVETIHKRDGGEIKDFLKIILEHPRDITKSKDKIQELPSVNEVREYDIPFYRRYLIDHKLFPMNYVEVQGKILKSHPKGTCIFEIENKPKNLDSSPNINVLSFSIETCNLKGVPFVNEDPIIMISFYSNQGFSKILTTKESSLDFVETVPTERELLEKFVGTIETENPDIIAGYNSDKYDFPYIKHRAEKLGVPLNLGVDGSKIKFYTGRIKFASIKGRIHVDIYKIVRRYLQLNHHTLKNVYQELCREDKVEIPTEEIYKCWVDGGDKLEHLFKYTLEM